MIKPLLGLCIVAAALPAAPFSIAAECSLADVKVVKRAVPAYPTRVKQRGIEGYVVLEFAIGTDGKPKDVKVFESQPQGTFDRAGMRAVMETRFKPCIVDGQPGEVAKAQLKYSFTQ